MPRFQALLDGGSFALYDQQLLSCKDWLVAPSLGAITPGWLLALPRCSILSYRDWEATGGWSALSVVASIASHLQLDISDVIWFEHGPQQRNTLVGCGLDHAHLHILLHPRFRYDVFATSVRQAADLNWTDVSSVTSYSTLPHGLSYFVAGSGDRAIRATDVESAGSQFFRRVVAVLAGKETEWDYRKHAHMSNIAQTIADFKRLENVSRRSSA